jgi:hypothetical protein
VHEAPQHTVDQELPELVQPFAWLLGTWRGEGVGGYPTLDAEDFRYGEEITFACPGKPLLTFTSRSWSLDDGRPLALQTGYWRPTSATAFETVVAVAAGLVEIGYGALVDGPSGVHAEVATHTIAHTETAKEVSADKRMYAVRGGQLMYAMDMAAMGHDLAPHLSAALARVD